MPVGLTANSFGSVSLEPPLVQWSLRVNSGLHRVFVDAAFFSVSVLSASQEAVAKQFASRAIDRFGDISISQLPNQPPFIQGALAHFLCRKVSDLRVGDHELFIGEVIHTQSAPGEPLLFHASKFKRATG